jgi:hypothetical protein
MANDSHFPRAGRVESARASAISQFSILNSQFRLTPIVLAALLLLTSCFENPLKETMEIVFERDGKALVRVDVEVAREGQTPEANQRLEQLRAELLDGRDAWARRFERVKAEDESFAWDKEQGKLRHMTRMARIKPDELGNLFYDTSVQFRYHEDGGYGELTIFTGASQRATRDQARQFNEAADEWSRAVARYYRALDELYRYTATYPDRAEGIFAIVFTEEEGGEKPKGDVDAAAGGSAAAPPRDEDDPAQAVTEEEYALAERVVKALEDVFDAQGWAQGREISADELARLVNDPFPSELLLRFEGDVEEYEGFVLEGDRRSVRVERKGLMEALGAMRGKWASPDPFHEMLDRAKAGDAAPPFSLADFLSKPRTSSPPSDWREVRAALDSALKPVGTYRVRWLMKKSPN